VAFWDGENFNISDISSDILETIEHFEDVKENRKDGFVPIEKIERIKNDELWKVKDEIG
jgi:hypothetical protein